MPCDLKPAVGKQFEGYNNVNDAMGLIHAISNSQWSDSSNVMLDSQRLQIPEGFAEIKRDQSQAYIDVPHCACEFGEPTLGHRADQ
jgi:hypothetical protein